MSAARIDKMADSVYRVAAERIADVDTDCSVPKVFYIGKARVERMVQCEPPGWWTCLFSVEWGDVWECPRCLAKWKRDEGWHRVREST